MKIPRQQYENPNTPFRFFRTFGRPWGQQYTYPDYVPMPTAGLRQMATDLMSDPVTGAIFRKAGIHGDIGPAEESSISDFVEAYAVRHGWEKPDPSNLVVSTVLARQLAEGAIAPEDIQTQDAFIEDKRCDGLDMLPKRTATKQYKMLRASEVIPILRWIERQEDLKAPWTALRSKTFSRGQDFFLSDEERNRANRISVIPGQVAVHKYGLRNRATRGLTSLINDLNSMYAVRKIDRYDGKEAIAWMTDSYHNNEIINDIENGPLA